jgi:hypothetical protein
MNNKAEDRDQAAPQPGVVTVTMLRAIDACLRTLQRLRSRFEAPAEEEGFSRGGGKRRQSGPQEPTAGEEPAPRPRGLLFRLLIMLICLLVGGGAGAYFSYRGLSKLVAARGAAMEQIQEELDIAKKEEARKVNLMAKFQKENAEFRLQMREAQREVEDYKSRIDELDKQLAAAKRVERPAPAGRRAAVPAASAKPRAPQKTGDCTVGTGNLSGNLTDCIEKFNRP